MACHCTLRESNSQPIPDSQFSAMLPNETFATLDQESDTGFDACFDDFWMTDAPPALPIPPQQTLHHSNIPYSVDPRSPSIFSSTFPSSVPAPPAKGSPTGCSWTAHGSASTCACLQSGLKSLTALSAASPSRICIFSKSFTLAPHRQQPRMVDAAFAANRDAMNSVAQILDCQHCSTAPTSQMILVAICDKLISWNQAAGAHFNNQISHSPTYTYYSSSASGGSTPLGSSSDAGGFGGENLNELMTEKLKRQSVKVGDFVLDEAVADQVIRCAILHDLQRIETLVNRLCASTNSCHHHGTNPQHRLAALLQNRLHGAKRAMMLLGPTYM